VCNVGWIDVGGASEWSVASNSVVHGASGSAVFDPMLVDTSVSITGERDPQPKGIPRVLSRLEGNALLRDAHESPAMSEPGPFAELLGRLAYGFWQIAPVLPTYLHIITAALFPIFTGAHASLCRPSSAADPRKDRESPANDASSDEDGDTDEDEDENADTRMEGLSPMDAITFPLLAGITLAGLYFLIKWLEDPELLTRLLTWYFSALGIFSVARLLSDSFGVFTSFVFPSRWSDGQRIWRFKNSRRRAESRFPSVEGGPSSSDSKFYRTCASPFPGLFSRINLSPKVNGALWTARISLTAKWSLLARWRGEPIMKSKFGANDIAGLVTGFLAIGAYSLITKSWWLTNLMGFGFSYGALQLISPTTFWTGTLVLMALFLYDIYFVFFT
jgi:minor histocompatibility antigen H13